MTLLRSLMIVGLLAAGATKARAEDAWAVGVTEQQKAAAQTELEQGNKRFVESDYAGAMGHYETAIKSWDHPAIRFNIVRCLIQLGKPIEASEQLTLALKYGEKPLEDSVYREALNYQKLLEGQIGELEVKCEQKDVSVTFDGKPLAKCPYTEKKRLTSGAHQLVAQREGYLTKTVDVIVIGGKVVSKSLELDPLTKAAHVEHRYPLWLPWAVFGGGIAIAGVGGLLDLNASGQMDAYDQAIASSCADKGCPADMNHEEKDRALRMNKIAIGVMSAGAAVAVAGAVMLVLNRGKTVYAESKETAQPTAFTVTPSDGGALATMIGSF